MALGVADPTGSYLAILDEMGELVSAVNDMRAMDALTPEHLERWAARLGVADMLIADCNLSAACLAWLCRFHEICNPLQNVVDRRRAHNSTMSSTSVWDAVGIVIPPPQRKKVIDKTATFVAKQIRHRDTKV